MSVGHLARLMEAAGIATVIIAVQAFWPRMEPMRLARGVLTPYLMGRPIGPAFAEDMQRHTLRVALDLLTTATQPEAVIELPEQ